jgi:hypothetical protein
LDKGWQQRAAAAGGGSGRQQHGEARMHGRREGNDYWIVMGTDKYRKYHTKNTDTDVPISSKCRYSALSQKVTKRHIWTSARI